MAEREDERENAEKIKDEQEEAGNRPEELSEPQIFCPWCGRRIPENSIYCEYCGKYVPDKAEESTGRRGFLSGKRFPLHICTKGRIAALAAVIVFLLFGLYFLPGESIVSPEPGIFYVKDNSLVRASGGSQKAQEYSAQYRETWGKRSGGGILEDRPKKIENGRKAVTGPVWSEDGRYLFYPERVEGESFDLVRLDRKKQETKTLDTGVTEFSPAGSGQVIYRKENEALYVYSELRKKKLSREPEWYRISEGGDSILWSEEMSGVTDIWYQRLEGEEEKKRLGRNAVVLDTSEDLSRILFQKEDAVYRIGDLGEPEKLAEEVSSVAGASAEENSFYFVRDVNRTPTTSYKELYYCKAGKTSLISDELEAVLWQDKELLLYTKKEERDCSLVLNGKSAELGREAVLPGQVERQGGSLYFLSLSEAENEGSPLYELCRASLSGEEFGKVMTIDGGISGIVCVAGDAVYYLKDVKEGQGELFKDGENVAYDVAADSVAQIPDSENVLCIADYSAGKRRGNLTLIQGDTSSVLADSIAGFSAVSENEIYMLSEYRFDKERGDLYLYDGQKAQLIDTDIWSFFGKGNSRICGYGEN